MLKYYSYLFEMNVFQDISAFYEDSFDTKLWINNILKENGSQDNKEVLKLII